MNNIIDPNIYELADCQKKDEESINVHFDYLNKIIAYFQQKGDLFIVSQNQYGLLYSLIDHPWNQYPSNTSQFNAIISIYRDFMYLINYDLLSLFDKNSPAIDDQRINHSSYRDSLCYNEFLKQITEIINNKNDYCLLMGTANFIKGEKLYFNGGKNVIYPINDINDEEVLFFSKGYRDLFINEHSVHPSLNNPLPNGSFCSEYKNIAEKQIHNGDDKIIVYRKISKEVALRNGYSFNKELSSINSNDSKIRDIYSFDSKIHISADVEHGGIEVFDNNGKHQGEYHYDGILKPNSKDKKGTHDIIIKKI